MKKPLALLLCVILILVTFGCSQTEQKEPQTTASQKNELTENSPEPTDKTETSVCTDGTEPTSESSHSEPTALTEALSVGGRPNSSFAVTTFFPADSCNIVYNELSAKNPREVKLKGDEKSKVLSVLNREIFSLVSYPWDIKLSDSHPSAKLTMTSGNSAITVGLFEAIGDKGYVTVERGAVFNHYTIPAADFNELTAILNSVG